MAVCDYCNATVQQKTKKENGIHFLECDSCGTRYITNILTEEIKILLNEKEIIEQALQTKRHEAQLHAVLEDDRYVANPSYIDRTAVDAYTEEQKNKMAQSLLEVTRHASHTLRRETTTDD